MRRLVRLSRLRETQHYRGFRYTPGRKLGDPTNAANSPANTPDGATNPVKAPLLPAVEEKDRFEEMMEDRTRALLKTLGRSLSSVASKDEQIFSSSEREKAELKQAINGNDESALNSSKDRTLGVANIFLFDTQQIYADLVQAGCTPGQAEVIMKTIQAMTEELIEKCYDRSVPNSAGANEAYLFDAASSEVRSEVQASRLALANQYRFGLSRLQRDVEILQHEATEITSLLKSDLDIEVHDRKNASRAEEGNVHLKIQELQNKIGTRLNSELKSEIEKLRWQITRRSIAAVVVASAAILYVSQIIKSETKRQPGVQESYGGEMQIPILTSSMAVDDYEDNPNTMVEALGEQTKSNPNIESGYSTATESSGSNSHDPSDRPS